MAPKTQSATILLVSKNLSMIESTHSILSKAESLSLIEKEMTSENLLPAIAETQPDVILLDYVFQPDPFDLMDKIALAYPECAVIIVMPEADLINFDQVVLLGSRAFVLFPYRSDNFLVTSIQRSIDLMVRNQALSSQVPTLEPYGKPNHTFTVFSPKGGVGSTTIAINLAISLHKALNEDVLLIDGKHLFGHVALYLNLRTGNSITDLISHAGVLDQRLITQVVTRHISGIHVLPSPN